MNNRTLSIIFLALLGIYLLTRLFSGRTESTFRSEIIQVDTSMVDKIELFPKTEDGKTVTIQKTNGQWTVTDGSVTAPAVDNSVRSILAQLALIKAKRVVARQQEKWKDYEVEETNGARVKAYGNGNVLADFIVGRFSFNQQARQATSYVRLANEDEVYGVDGFLSMTFGQDMGAFRNKEILKLDAGEQVSGLQLQSGGTTASFQQVNGAWMVNGGQPVDSTEMANYLNGLRYVAGNTFADDFTPAGSPELSLEIRTSAGSPVTVNAFQYTGGEMDFVIQSSQFPDSRFASDSSGIYNRIFEKLAALAGGG